VRGFWRGNEGKLPELASRITASADLFNKGGRRPWASVNFITAHDGFTLNDLVSFNEKHNAENGEDNRDGTSDNLSNNHGAEGPTDDPEIKALRFRQMRNMLATLFLSRGTPMLLAGDEFARSQKGNNNAYCQDNELSWIDWNGIDEDGRNLAHFTQKLARLRRALAMLRRGRFLSGSYDEEIGVKDIAWLNPNGEEMTDADWADTNARCMGVLMDGRAQETGVRRIGTDATILLVLNAHDDVVSFKLPQAAGGERWVRLIDTNQPEEEALSYFPFGQSYTVTGRSLLLFMVRPAEGARADTGPEDSFAHVVQAFRSAAAEPVMLPNV
jgi:glycogen operon protein